MSSPLLQIPKSVSLNPSFRRFVSRVNDSVQRTLACRRPWLELLDFDTFSRPLSFSDATSRVRKNVSYFRVNYLALLSGVLAFSLLSHPFSLISLSLLISAWLFLYFFKPPEQPLILFTRTFSNHETLALLLLVTIIMLFFTSVGSLLISTTLLGGVIICIHGAFRDPVDLFIESQDEVSSTGFFSIANGASIRSATAAVRDVAALV
ncbi:PRA1 family protein B3-like [Silene latifolia]|uniref:PRA1 family protein B3-like n=1 Tax=Silene latifolia TaxID=37657 RepID=UPI003D770EB6